MSALELESKIKEFKSAKGSLARHKALLNFGESLIIYCEGMLFGEYRKEGLLIEQVERNLYNCATRPASLGVHWGFVRDLTKNLPESPLAAKFPLKEKLEACSVAVFKFGLLKGAILNKDASQRITSDFSEKLDELSKGRNVPQAGKLAFFNDCFISVRNIFAHPDQVIKKTGEVVNWPLTDEYFDLINPLMESALVEIYDDLKSVFTQYPAAEVEIIETTGDSLTCKLSLGGGIEDLTIQLENHIKIDEEELVFVDYEKKQIYVQNYSRPPQVTAEMAAKIAKDEKKKQIIKVLEPLISQCLQDNEIDSTEYFSLKMTAESGYIEEDELKTLIGKVRQRQGLDIQFEIIDSSDGDQVQRFNPWWLKYLSIRKYLVDASVVERGYDQVVGTKTYVHASLFREFKDFLEYILSQSLDKGSEEPVWSIKMNNWQQGRLTSYLWARVSPVVSPIDTAYAIILYVPPEGENLSCGIGEDRARLQLFLRHQDPQGKLLINASEIIQEFIETNKEKLLEMESIVALIPKKWLSYKFFLDDFDAQGGFKNATPIPIKDYLAHEERYKQNYYLAWLSAPPLSEDDFYHHDINFDKQLGETFSIYGSIISRIADSALTLGLNVSEARRISRNYTLTLTQVIDDLKNQFNEKVEEGIISANQFKAWQSEAQSRLFYSDYKKLLLELKKNVKCQDATLSKEPPSESSMPELMGLLDQVRDDWKEVISFSEIGSPSNDKRLACLQKYGILGDEISLLPNALSVILGISFKNDGTSKATCAIVGNSKNAMAEKIANQFIFENDNWHFEDPDGERLLQANSGKGGRFVGVYRADSNDLDSLLECVNQTAIINQSNALQEAYKYQFSEESIEKSSNAISSLEEVISQVLPEEKITSKDSIRLRNLKRFARFGDDIELVPDVLTIHYGFRENRGDQLLAFVLIRIHLKKLMEVPALQTLPSYLQSISRNEDVEWKLMDDYGVEYGSWEESNTPLGLELQIPIQGNDDCEVKLNQCISELKEIVSSKGFSESLKSLRNSENV